MLANHQTRFIKEKELLTQNPLLDPLIADETNIQSTNLSIWTTPRKVTALTTAKLRTENTQMMPTLTQLIRMQRTRTLATRTIPIRTVRTRTWTKPKNAKNTDAGDTYAADTDAENTDTENTDAVDADIENIGDANTDNADNVAQHANKEDKNADHNGKINTDGIQKENTDSLSDSQSSHKQEKNDRLQYNFRTTTNNVKEPKQIETENFSQILPTQRYFNNIQVQQLQSHVKKN